MRDRTIEDIRNLLRRNFGIVLRLLAGRRLDR